MISVAPGASIGPITAKVKCTAHDPHAEESILTIVKEVHGYVTGPLRSEPSSVLVTAAELQQTPGIRIRLVPAAGTKLNSARVSDITPNLRDLVSCSVSMKDQGELVLRAKDGAASANGDASGAVLLAVNAGELSLGFLSGAGAMMSATFE
jgi:hypothetical protein